MWKMVLNFLKNQLNLLFEILETIFLNLNVPAFHLTIGRLKILWGWNRNMIGEDSDVVGGIDF